MDLFWLSNRTKYMQLKLRDENGDAAQLACMPAAHRRASKAGVSRSSGCPYLTHQGQEVEEWADNVLAQPSDIEVGAALPCLLSWM